MSHPSFICVSIHSLLSPSFLLCWIIVIDFWPLWTTIFRAVTMIPTATKGTCIPIVYFPTPNARHTIIYSHGNATDIGAMYSFYVALARELKVWVWCVCVLVCRDWLSHWLIDWLVVIWLTGEHNCVWLHRIRTQHSHTPPHGKTNLQRYWGGHTQH